MFIAHLPAGYLLTQYLRRKLSCVTPSLLWLGLVASVLPDSDLLLFYLKDHRQVHHHTYLTHLPLFWAGVGIAAWLSMIALKKRHYIPYVIVFTANVLLHMVLDTPLGCIRWLYPFSDACPTLVSITPHYHWWVWNFILHWTFVAEIVIIVVAFRVWIDSCKKPSS